MADRGKRRRKSRPRSRSKHGKALTCSCVTTEDYPPSDRIKTVRISLTDLQCPLHGKEALPDGPEQQG